MPANKKYLTTSKTQRFAKITAAILGGYLVTASLHMALSFWLDHTTVIITSTFTGFILWASLMVVAFLAKNGWKIWGIYLAFTLLFSIGIYLGQIYNPIV
ncbi:hypothetical protein [Formosa sp. A9]|uniref:hypothetical protein n=1 Tax=Formosa sp. A9 TaxID=3442641 RepID=UPI003EB73F9B